jgi:hypothetical protein
LERTADAKAPEPKDRHFITAEFPGQRSGHTGELDGARTDRVVTEDAVRLARGYGDEAFGSAGLMVLAGVLAQIVVELG